MRTAIKLWMSLKFDQIRPKTAELAALERLEKNPHCNGLNSELENVQKRAARFVTRNYIRETGCMTGILEKTCPKKDMH